MQSFLGGGDKGSSSNPLKQISQREARDASAFRDRFGTSSGPVSHPPFQARGQSPSVIHELSHQANTIPHPFNLSHLSAALSADTPTPAGPSFRAAPGPPIQYGHFESSWASQRSSPRPLDALSQQQPLDLRDRGWSKELNSTSQWAQSFQATGKGKGRAFLAEATAPVYGAHVPPFTSNRPYQPTFQPMYAGMIGQTPGQLRHGRTEEDHQQIEAAFERALLDVRAQESMTQQSVDENGEEIEEIIREPKGEFEKVWDSLRPEAERLGQLAEWERDFSQFTNDEDDLYDVLNDSLSRNDVGQTSLDQQFEFGRGSDPFDGFLDAENGLPNAHPYNYAEPNRFDDLSPVGAYTEGNRIQASGGSLTDATILLESFLRRATPQDYQTISQSEVEIWSLLGRLHAMNEKEERALSAFEQGRKVLEGKTAGSEKGAGEMLTNLAISYVNESLDLAALTTLHQYLRILHPSYAGPAPSRLAMSSSDSPWYLHQGITEHFLSLAREQYGQIGQVDPDVQVGLGTLYYMMGEYGQARDCWVAALGERPDDYLLWNRLGATLANGGDPEEAVDAYRRALELKPTFTRAIFNLGVACLNIGVHREAAEHFLAALSLHGRDAAAEREAQPYDSGGLWLTLRRALNALDMPELANQAKPGTDLEVFRRAGFEF